jgi:dienelactone hydrolase
LKVNILKKLTATLPCSVFLALLLLTGCVSSPTVVKEQKFNFLEKTLVKSAPTVILSHGSDCDTRHASDFATKLNDWGYNAIVLNHCVRRGILSHIGRASYLSPWDRTEDYFKIASWIKKQKWHNGKIAVIGWSQGGSGVVSASDYQTQRNLGMKDEDINLIDAFVAYYPACDLATLPTKAERPFLIHHGVKDSLALIAKCPYGRLKDTNYRILKYADAGHSFDMFGPDVMTCREPIGCYKSREYSSSAHKKSVDETKRFLDEHLN